MVTSSPVLRVVLTALAYWVISISLTLLYKWTFSFYGFHFPITLIFLLFSLEWIIAVIIRFAGPLLCTSYEPKYLERQAFLKYAVPIGVSTAIEVGGSNLSLLTLSVAFHTMIRSSNPVSVLLFSFLFGLRKVDCYLTLIIAIVTAGIALCSFGEVDFALTGFTYVLISVLASGVRWTMSQKLLQNQGDASQHLDPLSLLYYVLPISMISLPPFFYYLEYQDLLAYIESQEDAMHRLLELGCIVLLFGLLAFSLILIELILIQLTSSLTFAVSAVCKELLLIMISIILFHDHLTILTIIGFGITLCGIFMYKVHTFKQKHKEMQQQDAEDSIRLELVQPGDAEDDLLSSAGDIELVSLPQPRSLKHTIHHFTITGPPLASDRSLLRQGYGLVHAEMDDIHDENNADDNDLDFDNIESQRGRAYLESSPLLPFKDSSQIPRFPALDVEKNHNRNHEYPSSDDLHDPHTASDQDDSYNPISLSVSPSHHAPTSSTSMAHSPSHMSSSSKTSHQMPPRYDSRVTWSPPVRAVPLLLDRLGQRVVGMSSAKGKGKGKYTPLPSDPEENELHLSLPLAEVHTHIGPPKIPDDDDDDNLL